MEQDIKEEINKKIEYFKQISIQNPEQLNNDQFKAIEAVLKRTLSFEELNVWTHLLEQRVGFGFKFDEAPHVKEVTKIPVLVKDEKRSLAAEKVPSFTDNGKTPPNHVLIVGENWQVLQNLLITCYKSIDVIYIDPPYNTGGSDLTYEDKFSKNAWLNMMKQRMEIAYQLLSDDGVIFVSLDDNMQAYFKVMMDGIFGEENFICNFIWEKNYSLKNNNKFVSENHDYVLCYAKNKNYLDHFGRLDRTDENNELYKYDDYDGRGKYRLGDLTTKGLKGYSIIHNGIEYKEKAPNGWRFNEDEMNNKIKNNEIYFPKKPNGIPQLKRYLRDVEGVISATILPYTLVGHTDENQKILDSIIDFTEKGDRKFNYPKGTKLIKYLINLCPKKDHQIILDFFAGSGTTAQAVLELNKEDNGNRQFILCQVDTSKKNDKDKEIKETTKNETTSQLTLDDLDKQNKKATPVLNIAYDVCYERLYRIATGKGTNGETFDWLNKKNDHNQPNEPFFNALDVYYINEIDISLKNNPHAEFLKKIDFAIYNKLYHDTHLDDKLNPELNLNINNASTILYPLLDHIKE